MNTDTLVSVVLPAHNQADHIGEVVREYSAVLARMPLRHEIVLVPNGSTDDTEAVCANLAATIPDVRNEPAPRGGWGRAVRFGIGKAKGDLICYTNSARTAASELTLDPYAAMHPHGRQGEPEDPRSLVAPPGLPRVQPRVPGALRPVDLGRERTPKVFRAPAIARAPHATTIHRRGVRLGRRTANYPMPEAARVPVAAVGGVDDDLKSVVRMYRGAWSMRRHAR